MNHEALTLGAVLKGCILSIGVTALGYGLDYLLHISVSNLLNPADYGDFSVAISWAMFWSICALLGGSKSTVKFLPGYMKEKNVPLGAGLLQFYFRSAVLIGLGIAVVGFALAYLDVDYMKKIGSDEYHPLILALFLLPLIAFSNLSTSVLVSSKHYLWSIIPKHLLLPAIVLVLLWSLYAFNVTINDWLLVSLLFVAYLLLNASQFLAVRKVAKIKITDPNLEYRVERWLRISIPIMLSSLTIFAMRQLDLTMVELLSPTEREVGFFAAAIKISEWFMVIMFAASSVLNPFISLVVKQGIAEQQKIYNLHIKSTLLPCIILGILLLFFGRTVLSTFGADYTVAYGSLVYLVIAMFCMPVSMGAYYFLQFSGCPKLILASDVVALIINLVLNVILIPQYGMEGAAIATMVAYVFVAVLRFGLAAYILKLKPTLM